MKIKTIAPLVFVLFLAAAGYSQDNSCAYTFTYPKPDFSFLCDGLGNSREHSKPNWHKPPGPRESGGRVDREY
jgi:hypothetical protein